MTPPTRGRRPDRQRHPLCRSIGCVLVQSLRVVGRQAGGGGPGGVLRGGSHSAACARPLRRPADGGGATPGHAALSGSGAVYRAEQRLRAPGHRSQSQARSGTERESRARDHGVAHTGRPHRLPPDGCHRVRPGIDRMDGVGLRARRVVPGQPGFSASGTTGTNPARVRSAAADTNRGARRRRRPSCAIWPPPPRPPTTCR